MAAASGNSSAAGQHLIVTKAGPGRPRPSVRARCTFTGTRLISDAVLHDVQTRRARADSFIISKHCGRLSFTGEPEPTRAIHIRTRRVDHSGIAGRTGSIPGLPTLEPPGPSRHTLCGVWLTYNAHGPLLVIYYVLVCVCRKERGLLAAVSYSQARHSVPVRTPLYTTTEVHTRTQRSGVCNRSFRCLPGINPEGV